MNATQQGCSARTQGISDRDRDTGHIRSGDLRLFGIRALITGPGETHLTVLECSAAGPINLSCYKSLDGVTAGVEQIAYRSLR